MKPDRRRFLTAAAAGVALSKTIASAQGRGQGAPAGGGGGRGQQPATPPPDPALVARAHGTWCLFSRHLQYVSTEAETVADPMGVGVKIGEAAKAIGLGAVNLTVRDTGHVSQANATTHLPPMLKGIRSTGIICEKITTTIVPPVDSQNTDWLKTQNVVDILTVASANGIKKYRIGGGLAYPASGFGKAMTDYLDGLRVNMQRLYDLNRQYNLQAVYHTQGGLGQPLWDLMYVWKDMDPKYIGFNYAVGHIVENNSITSASSMWAMNLRWIMPYFGDMAMQDSVWVTRPDGTMGVSTPLTGKGNTNWAVFFRLLREGGYNGFFDAHQEYPITLTDGTSTTMMATWFADHDLFKSGRLTPPMMVAAMKNDFDFYKAKAAEAGWTKEQLTPAS